MDSSSQGRPLVPFFRWSFQPNILVLACGRNKVHIKYLRSFPVPISNRSVLLVHLEQRQVLKASRPEDSGQRMPVWEAIRGILQRGSSYSLSFSLSFRSSDSSIFTGENEVANG